MAACSSRWRYTKTRHPLSIDNVKQFTKSVEMPWQLCVLLNYNQATRQGKEVLSSWARISKSADKQHKITFHDKMRTICKLM